MICNADEYLATGRHHHVAILEAGHHFEGIYLIKEAPLPFLVDDQECLEFVASDLTGAIRCVITRQRAGWQQGEMFKAQRLHLQGRVMNDEHGVTAQISELVPVTMIW